MKKILTQSRGHLVKAGPTAGQYANPYTVWEDHHNNEKFVEMFDSKGNSFVFDYDQLERVVSLKSDRGNDVTWFVNGKQNAYVCCKLNSKTFMFLHTFLKKGSHHIDHNPMNNRLSNLEVHSTSPSGPKVMISKHQGHSNPYTVWEDSHNNKRFVEMFDSSGRSFFFDYDQLEKVTTLRRDSETFVTWYTSKQRNGKYRVLCTRNGEVIPLHTHLTGKKRVYHIDRNPLNNRLCNLTTHAHRRAKETPQTVLCPPTNLKKSTVNATIPPQAKIISEHRGRFVTVGATAGQYANPYKVWKNDNNKRFVEMFDSKGNSFVFDFDCLEKVLTFQTDKKNNVSWYVTKVGATVDGKRDLHYVCCRNDVEMIYLHAYLMNHMGQGKGQLSIDHIDRDPLNNRLCNLRVATQTEQNKNTKKRARKKSARPLPPEIDVLPKYVVYYWEKQNNALGYRDHFKVEKHPAQVAGLHKDKWGTTKSMKVSPTKKLEQAIHKVHELDQLVLINSSKGLPNGKRVPA